MKLKKSSLLMIVAVILTLALSIGSTLAYLTDTDQDVNVMVLGNVEIEQVENFTQNSLLMPAVENADGVPLKNAITKEVSVKNTGKNAAFVRTVFAFEMGTLSEEDFKTYVNYEFADGGEWAVNDEIGQITIAGKKYYMMSATRNEALPAGATSGNNLLKVWLDKTTDNAQLKAIDGNGDGNLTVIALSQGVQTEGFDDAETALNAAFTEGVALDTTNHPWLKTVSDLTGGTAGDNLNGDGTTTLTSTYSLNNNTISNYIIDAAVAHVVNASQVKGHNEFNNCVFTNSKGGSNSVFWVDTIAEGATITFNDCDFEGNIKLGVYNKTAENNKYIFNNCTFSGTPNWSKALIVNYANIELNNCTFDRSEGAEFDVRLAEGVTTANVKVTGDGNVFVKNYGANNSGALEVVYEGYNPETPNNADTTAEGLIKYENAAGQTINAVTSSNGLTSAVVNSEDEEVTVELMKAGEYTLPSMTGKEVTLSGTKDTVIDTTNGMPNTTNAALTFEGVTIDFKKGGSFGTNGFTHSEKVVYKNCTITGTQFLYSEAEFINCTFVVEGDAYAVWTYGSPKATFTNCTFNTDGKAILVYLEAAADAKITVEGCTFNATTNRSKAAVEVGESAYGNQAKYKIVISDSTADTNFTTNHSTSNLWGNKNDMPVDRLNIFINGTEVY